MPALILLLCAGCSGGDDSSGPTTTTTTTGPSTTPSTTEPGTAATPASSARTAVEALLKAEQGGDHTASYRLLTAAGRTEVGDLGDWAELRGDVPAISAFTIEGGDSPDTVVALVEHKPGLDPFIGLSAARERQTWTAEREAGGWLVGPTPSTEYILPPDADVAGAVTAWAVAVQACDQAKAATQQAVPEPFGLSEDAAKLCGSTGVVTVGPVGSLAEGPDSAALVAQYSSDVLEWARVVEVSGPTPPFSVVVAPIGDRWQVLGVSD